jgi:hypothetical protein
MFPQTAPIVTVSLPMGLVGPLIDEVGRYDGRVDRDRWTRITFGGCDCREVSEKIGGTPATCKIRTSGPKVGLRLVPPPTLKSVLGFRGIM